MFNQTSGVTRGIVVPAAENHSEEWSHHNNNRIRTELARNGEETNRELTTNERRAGRATPAKQ